MNICYEAPLYHFCVDFTFYLHRSKWVENTFIHLNWENETVQAFCSIIHIKKKSNQKISFFTSGTSLFVFKSTWEKNQNQKIHVRSKEGWWTQNKLQRTWNAHFLNVFSVFQNCQKLNNNLFLAIYCALKFCYSSTLNCKCLNQSTVTFQGVLFLDDNLISTERWLKSFECFLYLICFTLTL